MAEKTISTRIKLKYDTYENWTTNNPVLLAGELAITSVPTATGDVKSAPAILIKVGDGVSTYQNLQFVSGLAANVYDWAKASVKPSYTADEITGLSDYIANEIEDTDTTYQIVKVDDYNYKLQSKPKGGNWADVSEITIPKYDDTTVKSGIASLQALVGSTAVATQIANAIDALKLDTTYAKKTEIGTIEEGKTVVDMINDAYYDDTDIKNKISTLQGTDTNKSARAIASEEVAKIVAGADTAYDTLKEISDWISSHLTDAAAMNSAIVALQGLVGDTKVSVQIKNAIDALKIGDYAKAADLTALAARVAANEGKITNLETHALLDTDTFILDCGNSSI